MPTGRQLQGTPAPMGEENPHLQEREPLLGNAAAKRGPPSSRAGDSDLRAKKRLKNDPSDQNDPDEDGLASPNSNKCSSPGSNVCATPHTPGSERVWSAAKGREDGQWSNGRHTLPAAVHGKSDALLRDPDGALEDNEVNPCGRDFILNITDELTRDQRFMFSGLDALHGTRVRVLSYDHETKECTCEMQNGAAAKSPGDLAEPRVAIQNDGSAFRGTLLTMDASGHVGMVSTKVDGMERLARDHVVVPIEKLIPAPSRIQFSIFPSPVYFLMANDPFLAAEKGQASSSSEKKVSDSETVL